MAETRVSEMPSGSGTPNPWLNEIMRILMDRINSTGTRKDPVSYVGGRHGPAAQV